MGSLRISAADEQGYFANEKSNSPKLGNKKCLASPRSLPADLRQDPMRDWKVLILVGL